MNRLAGMLTYLVGPMEQEVNRGSEWRVEITAFLQKRLSVGVLNPCDKPASGENVAEDYNLYTKINSTKVAARQHELRGEIENANILYESAHKLCQPFVRYDLRMVDIAHFIVMHVNPDIHMCGSYGEQAVATLQRKPVIVFCPQGKDRIPNWLYGILKPEMFFTCMDEVQNYLLHVAYDHEVDDLNRWRFIDMNKVYGNKVF
jgi:hypothetical protein